MYAIFRQLKTLAVIFIQQIFIKPLNVSDTVIGFVNRKNPLRKSNLSKRAEGWH